MTGDPTLLLAWLEARASRARGVADRAQQYLEDFAPHLSLRAEILDIVTEAQELARAWETELRRARASANTYLHTRAHVPGRPAADGAAVIRERAKSVEEAAQNAQPGSPARAALEREAAELRRRASTPGAYSTAARDDKLRRRNIGRAHDDEN